MADSEGLEQNELDEAELLEAKAKYEAGKRGSKQRIQIALAVAAFSIAGFSGIATSLLGQKSRSAFDSSEFLLDLFRAREVVRIPDFEKTKGELLASLKTTLEQSAERSYIGSDNAITGEQIAQLDARLSLIEKSISDNPERALSIPLLRRDQDELNRKLEEFRLSAKADSDRVWSQQNTILQGIGALLLAVAVAAVTILYRAIKPNETKSQQ